MDFIGKSDPFVKVYVRPGRVEKDQLTKVIKDDLNPVFNEEFKFLISSNIKKKTVVLRVFDKDKIGEDPIGEVRMESKNVSQ